MVADILQLSLSNIARQQNKFKNRNNLLLINTFFSHNSFCQDITKYISTRYIYPVTFAADGLNVKANLRACCFYSNLIILNATIENNMKREVVIC